MRENTDVLIVKNGDRMTCQVKGDLVLALISNQACTFGTSAGKGTSSNIIS